MINIFRIWLIIAIATTMSNTAEAYTLKGGGSSTVITCTDGDSFVQEGLMSQSSATKICAEHGGIHNRHASQ